MATQVISIPHPYVDIRYQLKYLRFRDEELLFSENEAQFLLIHATGAEAKRSIKRKIDTIHEEMKITKLSIQYFSDVLDRLQFVIQKNLRDYEKRQEAERGYRRQQQRSMSYINDDDEYPYYSENPHGSPRIRRMNTNTSLSSGSSRSSQRHKPNEIEDPRIQQESSSRQLELESIIEQQRKILMELEIERQRLQSQNQYTQMYPPYDYQQQQQHQSTNFSVDDFSYANDFQRSSNDYSSTENWEAPPTRRDSYLPPDTRD